MEQEDAGEKEQMRMNAAEKDKIEQEDAGEEEQSMMNAAEKDNGKNEETSSVMMNWSEDGFEKQN